MQKEEQNENVLLQEKEEFLEKDFPKKTLQEAILNSEIIGKIRV
ncbi:MAG TPA: hypothetical protein P5048_01590 [Chlamydiales bacterium]|nr:hypothetical protein [Chlamydiales bacterium]